MELQEKEIEKSTDGNEGNENEGNEKYSKKSLSNPNFSTITVLFPPTHNYKHQPFHQIPTKFHMYNLGYIFTTYSNFR